MEENILDIIEEQSSFQFSGKINILDHQTNQYFGSLSMDNGLIVTARVGSSLGQEGVISSIIMDVDSSKKINYIIEPEVIESDGAHLKIDFEDFKDLYYEMKTEFANLSKFRPPENINLIVDGGFILDGPNIEGSEFKLLKLITEFSLVKDIYENSPLNELLTTKSLISLRKKKALKVVG